MEEFAIHSELSILDLMDISDILKKTISKGNMSYDEVKSIMEYIEKLDGLTSQFKKETE